MVLQAEKPIIFWGWADAGEKVAISFADEKVEVVADDKGKWRANLPARKARSAPLTITIKGKNTLTLDDVLVGEVWLGSGQSNMEMGVSNVQKAADEIAAANYPQIRFFMVTRAIAGTPQDDLEGTWKVCTPQSITEGGWGGFSATAYFFGRSLYQSLNVPVGLIDSCWGGTPIESWIPAEGFALSPSFQSITDHIKGLEGTNNFVNNNPNQPAALYNGMIHPLEPLSMRGIIWYQGEANMGDLAYAEKTRVQVESWRTAFAQPDLPYYYTMIAPFTYSQDKTQQEVLPAFWQVQASAMSIPNTGMIVTTDIGDPANIHPTNKQEVGRRLSLWALAKTYGHIDLVFSGPTYQSMKTEGTKLRVTFDHADGLASSDGKDLTHFEIMDVDQGVFKTATATIDGPSVVLSAEGVIHPSMVRFAWNQTPQPNLVNGAGLPAMPFRAGDLSQLDATRQVGAEMQGYQLVYDVDLAKVTKPFAYDVDDSAKVTKPFDRIAYLLEIANLDRKPQYVYVSLDAFTNDVHQIGVPTFESHAIFKQNVANMNVLSNVEGVVTGTGLQGGNIEFWPNDYGKPNTAHVPNASDGAYDFGDQMDDAAPSAGYGSMQVHNHDAKQTIFSYNHWSSSPQADVGIGNQPTGEPDWTMAANGENFPNRRLRIYVHFKP